MLIEINKHEERLPRILTYSMAIAELFLAVDTHKQKLWEAKLEALKKVWSLLEWYASDLYDEDLLDAIMEKKARMILDVSTIKDARELGEPPKPHYTGSKWITSDNSVPEEEMIWWSKASLKAPLNEDAFKRYMELFRDFYGERADRIFDAEGGMQ